MKITTLSLLFSLFSFSTQAITSEEYLQALDITKIPSMKTSSNSTWYLIPLSEELYQTFLEEKWPNDLGYRGLMIAKIEPGQLFTYYPQSKFSEKTLTILKEHDMLDE